MLQVTQTESDVSRHTSLLRRAEQQMPGPGCIRWAVVAQLSVAGVGEYPGVRPQGGKGVAQTRVSNAGVVLAFKQ